MNLGQMPHIIRAVAECTDCVSLLVISSQAILRHCQDRVFDIKVFFTLENDDEGSSGPQSMWLISRTQRSEEKKRALGTLE